METGIDRLENWSDETNNLNQQLKTSRTRAIRFFRRTKTD